jgi:monofunctional chorismate mutase
MLDRLRKEIDEIDRKIIELLKRRFEIVSEIARLKKDLGMDIKDDEREKAIIENCKKVAPGMEDFVEELMRLIINQSKKVQKNEGRNFRAEGNL